MYSRSLFAGNASSIRYQFTIPSSSNSSGGTDLDPLFNSTVYKTIMNFNTHFVNGDFSYLVSNLTLQNYNTMVSSLYALRSTDPAYEKVRLIINSILTNLYQGVIQHQILVSAEKNLESCNETAAILNSIQSILKYIENLKHTNYLFSTSVSAVAAKLKPEYSIFFSS